MTGRYELLEHTADVGIRATGDSQEEVFGAAAEALAEIMGAWFPGEGDPTPVEVEAPDPEALLVSWLDELLYLHEAHDAVFGGFEVERVGEDRVRAAVRLAPRGDRTLDGQGVKAATYHQLRLTHDDGGWVGEIYLDV